MRFFPKYACLFAGIATFCSSVPVMAQTGPESPPATLTAEAKLPDAPQSQPPQAPPAAPAQNPSPTPESEPGSNQDSTQDSNARVIPSTGASSNNLDASQAQSDGQQKSEHERAEEELKVQEKQRVVGVVPTFNVTYRHDAATMSPGQKMKLALHSAVDPFTIGTAFLQAGYHEAANDLTGFSWGVKGYAERVGVSYLDSFNGTILSNGVVPIIFHQDPRYFRLGHGATSHRVLYALASTFIAKHDYTGKWEPNYGNLLGNFAAGALSNLYYPAGNTSISLTVTTTMLQIAEGAAGGTFNEFWPDLSRRFLHRDPTHGQDAQYNQMAAGKAP